MMKTRDEISEITLQEAMAQAKAEVERLRASDPSLKGYEFGPLQLSAQQEEETWKFYAVSEQLVEEGCVPGAFIVNVDKRDGHIWTKEEIMRRAERAIQSARK